jgi:putative transposase
MPVPTKKSVLIESVEVGWTSLYFADDMFPTIFSLFCSIRQSFRARAALQAEILALRHQLLVLQRWTRSRKLRLSAAYRLLWVWLSRLWSEWRSALVIVKPETVIAWHRRGFRLYWSWKSRHPLGRPSVSRKLVDLIRKMSLANPLWGAPRIHGELLKLGFELSEATVAKYMARHRKPPSQTWRTFLANHAKDLVSSDFFVVPTVFFRVLFVFVILSHDRRRPVRVAVTENPTAEWVAHQLLEAFPWDSAPRYQLRDRDGSYGERFREAANWLGIREVLTAPQSPWQNAYVERLIRSIRRGCLDHVIVLNETGLRRILKSYFEYYERTRTHLSLGKDAPISRPIQTADQGRIVEVPQVGGLHHRYERIAT